MSTQSKSETINQSGKTFLKNGNVIWEFDDKSKTEIPIDRIKLIAEYTTANGPFLDDWFLVIYNDKSEYFEISMYADNIQEMMTELGKSLDFELYATLFASADWKTNILYPTEFSGQELWKSGNAKPTSTFDKLTSLIGINNTELKMTEVAEKIIE